MSSKKKQTPTTNPANKPAPQKPAPQKPAPQNPAPMLPNAITAKALELVAVDTIPFKVPIVLALELLPADVEYLKAKYNIIAPKDSFLVLKLYTDPAVSVKKYAYTLQDVENPFTQEIDTICFTDPAKVHRQFKNKKRQCFDTRMIIPIKYA